MDIITNYVFDKNYFTYEEILTAYLDCRKRKRNSKYALEFEMNLEENLKDLLDEVNSGTYKIGVANVFTITDPKPREIWAAHFRDRIVHHLIYNEIHEYFEKRYIYDTYSCIPNKGTLKAVQRAYRFLRKCSQSNAKKIYYAKVDVKNFFVSISKDILWFKIAKVVNPNSLIGRLIFQNIYNNVTTNYRISKNSDLSLVPKHKSLFHANAEKYGLPIGNLTSQFYSNIYLNSLDQYCKHILKIKYYIRYVDDILIFSDSKEFLQFVVKKINAYLHKNLELSLHKDKILISTATQGISFLGQKIYPYGFRTGKRMRQRFRNAVLSGDILSVQSYKGLLKHGKNFNLVNAIHSSTHRKD